jgi:Skp family chaperone for outer membrane proteins
MTHARFSSPSLQLAAVACALLLASFAGPAAAQQPAAPRFGWVNSQLIIRQVPGYAQAESTLNAEVAGFRDEVQQLQSRLDSTVREYDRQQIALSPTARQAKEQEIREMQQRLQQRYSELQDRNLIFIVDVGAPGNNIVAADRTLDLTTVIVQRLQASQ